MPPAERIAVFDNDGTLWAEQPLYFQLAFRNRPASRPWRRSIPSGSDAQPFKGIIEGDLKAVSASGEHGLLEIMAATHSRHDDGEIRRHRRWLIEGAEHPRFKRPYTHLVYQPMLELLAYLRANGFKTFIVSGGGVEFMRTFAERVYGIPPEQVVGSTGVVKFEHWRGRKTGAS